MIPRHDELLSAKVVITDQDKTLIKFSSNLYKLVWMLCAMEAHKHLDPMFSNAFKNIYFLVNDKFKFTDRKTTTQS